MSPLIINPPFCDLCLFVLMFPQISGPISESISKPVSKLNKNLF